MCSCRSALGLRRRICVGPLQIPGVFGVARCKHSSLRNRTWFVRRTMRLQTVLVFVADHTALQSATESCVRRAPFGSTVREAGGHHEKLVRRNTHGHPGAASRRSPPISHGARKENPVGAQRHIPIPALISHHRVSFACARRGAHGARFRAPLLECDSFFRRDPVVFARYARSTTG